MMIKLQKRIIKGSVGLYLFISILACGTSSTVNTATRMAALSTLETIATQKSSDLIETIIETQFIQPTDVDMPTEIPLATLTPGLGSTFINPTDGALLVYIPEGEFIMGSDDPEAYESQKPAHELYLDAFWMYQTEVTNAHFGKFVEATNYVTSAEEMESVPFFAGYGRNAETLYGSYWNEPGDVSLDIPVIDNHPVVYMSWFDADAYCKWAGGRLPTEAEWEKAARGTDNRMFPWGNDPVSGEKANFCDVTCAADWKNYYEDDGYHFTSPAGNYPNGVSPYGVLDMAGNVDEWVADWFSEDYYQVSPKFNPIGPDYGESKSLRGGDYISDENGLRVTSRSWMDPAFPWNTMGFRCVLDN